MLIITGAVARRKKQAEGEIEVRSLNEHFEDMQHALEDAVLDVELLKKMIKEDKKRDKVEAKARKKAIKSGLDIESERKRIYVIDFNGDLYASDTDAMRE